MGQAIAEIPNGPSGEAPSGSRRSPRVDVEFAHQCAVPCDELLTEAEIASSTQVAAGLVEFLRGEAVDTVTTVLVDDKKNASDDIDERRAAAVARCVDDLGADRVMLESELVHHLHDFAASLPPDNTIINGFYGRLRRNGELACSQDVTIWHSLRLGLFEPTDARWAWDATTPESARPADVSVVILPRRFQKYEEKAYTENLAGFLGHATKHADRMTLEGQYRGRKVGLWAIWVDAEAGSSDADLQEQGRIEAEALMEVLVAAPC